MRRRRSLAIAVLALLPGVEILAKDVVRLKDGRSLVVEAWRYQGDQFVFEIESGSVTIPRSLVERVEPGTPPATVPSAAEKPAFRKPPRRSQPAPPAPSPPPAPRTVPAAGDNLLDPLEWLKRELRNHPQRSEAIAREIAVSLAAKAYRADERRDLAAAESLFQEALTYDSRCLPALIGLSNTYLKEGKDLYARSQIQEALVAHPKDPSLHYLLGAVYYQQENLQDAIAEWETSLSLKHDSRVATRLEKARREIAVDRDFARTDAPHFTLRYEGGAAEPLLASSVRDYLEEKYGDLATRFRFVPPAPIVVLLYPSRDFFELTRQPSTVNGLFDGKIRIPLGGIHSMTPEVRAVLLHELTHAFVFGKTRGNCPRWLQEGLAQLLEGKGVHPREERALARDLAASEGRSWYEQFSYPSSLSFTRYLADRFRLEALVDTLERMAAGLSAEEGLKEVTHEEFRDLQKAWVEELVKRFSVGS